MQNVISVYFVELFLMLKLWFYSVLCWTPCSYILSVDQLHSVINARQEMGRLWNWQLLFLLLMIENWSVPNELKLYTYDTIAISMIFNNLF